MPKVNQEVRFYYATIKKKVKIKSQTGPSTTDIRTLGVVCSSALNFAKFLDIPDTTAAVPSERVSAVIGHQRTLVNATGGSGTTAVVEHERGIPFPTGRPGSKRVILFTGKPTGTNSNRKHQISISVPSIMSLKDISDFLGEIISPSKIKSDPGATDVKPFFKVMGGGRYPIMTQTEAKTSTAAAVPLTTAESNQMAVTAKEGQGQK